MSFLISLCFISSLFIVPLYIYRSFYVRPVAALRIRDGSSTLISIYPTKKTFRELKKGLSSSMVHLGSGYFGFFIDSDELPDLRYQIGDIDFPSYVIVFKRNRFGRFVNLDLNNRVLFDIVKKFSEVK